jgi:hypothetical protein
MIWDGLQLDFPINENYHVDINGLYKMRNFSDGISFLEIKINLDTYVGDHNPQGGIQIVFFNINVLEIRIYNIHHRDTLKSKEIKIPCPNCGKDIQARMD